MARMAANILTKLKVLNKILQSQRLDLEKSLDEDYNTVHFLRQNLETLKINKRRMQSMSTSAKKHNKVLSFPIQDSVAIKLKRRTANFSPNSFTKNPKKKFRNLIGQFSPTLTKFQPRGATSARAHFSGPRQNYSKAMKRPNGFLSSKRSDKHSKSPQFFGRNKRTSYLDKKGLNQTFINFRSSRRIWDDLSFRKTGKSFVQKTTKKLFPIDDKLKRESTKKFVLRMKGIFKKEDDKLRSKGDWTKKLVEKIMMKRAKEVESEDSNHLEMINPLSSNFIVDNSSKEGQSFIKNVSSRYDDSFQESDNEGSLVIK